MDIDRLLQAVVEFSASDLHLQVGSPPSVRIHGTLRALDLPPLTDEQVREVVSQVASDDVQRRLKEHRSVDFSLVRPGLARYRVNIFHQQDSLAVVLRQIPLEVPRLDDLQLPKAIEEITYVERGLVLVTGTTGSGKSTTLAAIIDRLNHSRRLRVITIEDPIEFVHTSDRCLIAQRELGADALSFADSLRGALRQDPDVILVGELRDLETMRTAMRAADTGHLVFSTMHTTNAAQTVQRMITMFPTEERELLLTQLATNLEAVISQRLAKATAGGRLPVVEIMRDTALVRKLILENRITSLSQAIANGDQGMQLFDQHLARLYNENKISGTEALRLSTNPDAVAMAMRGISSEQTSAGLVK